MLSVRGSLRRQRGCGILTGDVNDGFFDGLALYLPNLEAWISGWISGLDRLALDKNPSDWIMRSSNQCGLDRAKSMWTSKIVVNMDIYGFKLKKDCY